MEQLTEMIAERRRGFDLFPRVFSGVAVAVVGSLVPVGLGSTVNVGV